MACSLSNKCAKYLSKRTVLLQLIIKNVVTCFLEHSVDVTAHPSTASVPITVLLYNGPLLCGFNVPIKGLTLVQDGFQPTCARSHYQHVPASQRRP